MVTASDVRAELARHRVFIYQVAPLVNLHPAHLGRLLNGKTPFREDVADRIMQAITDLVAAR